MKKSVVLWTLVASVSLFGSELKDLKLKARTDKANPIDYKVGESIRFGISLDGVKELPAEAKEPLHVIWERTGDDGVREKGTNDISLAQGFTLTTKLGVPGIVRYEAYLTGADYKPFNVQVGKYEKGVKLHAGAGAETEKMQLTTKEPADFDAFWKDAKAKLATVPVKAKVTDVTPEKNRKFKIYAVEIDCFGPRPATGWMTIPANAKPGSLKAIGQFDGYNGNRFGVPHAPSSGPADAIFLHVNAHGYEMIGHDKAYYTEYGNRVNGVVPGAKKRASYALEPSDYENPKDTYFYYMAMRVMRTFDYLKSRPEWNGKDLEAQGGSQGGLQTMWAAGLVDGLTAARPSITWGCNIGNRDVPGSKLLTRGWGIPPVAGAFYFDSALHAKRVPKTCQVEITRLGLGDYTCPPRGVLLSYYLMNCPVKANLYQGSTHGYVPPAPNQVFTISR
ncbi:MAG: acetylxylan esterase [bacterium]|nr:acetylxylan esterase [bacterium]